MTEIVGPLVSVHRVGCTTFDPDGVFDDHFDLNFDQVPLCFFQEYIVKYC